MSEPEVPDEAYIAAAIADAGFAVVRSNACGMPQARVGFKQPHLGYSSDGSVMVSEARARECLPTPTFHPNEDCPDERNEPGIITVVAAVEKGEREWQGGLEQAVPGLHICTTEDFDGYVAPVPPKKARKRRERNRSDDHPPAPELSTTDTRGAATDSAAGTKRQRAKGVK